MKNKIFKVVGVYALLFTVCTSSFVVFASAIHYRNEGEKPAPMYLINANNETYGEIVLGEFFIFDGFPVSINKIPLESK